MEPQGRDRDQVVREREEQQRQGAAGPRRSPLESRRRQGGEPEAHGDRDRGAEAEHQVFAGQAREVQLPAEPRRHESESIRMVAEHGEMRREPTATREQAIARRRAEQPRGQRDPQTTVLERRDRGEPGRSTPVAQRAGVFLVHQASDPEPREGEQSQRLVFGERGAGGRKRETERRAEGRASRQADETVQRERDPE